MPAIVIILALVGLVGIVAGFMALRKNWVNAKNHQECMSHQHWFWVLLAIGVVLGVASWPLTFFMGYPVNVEPQPGRVVGIPFFVAYFDSEGRDYVGPLTVPGAIANSIFWFLIPQILLHFLALGSFNSERT